MGNTVWRNGLRTRGEGAGRKATGVEPQQPHADGDEQQAEGLGVGQTPTPEQRLGGVAADKLHEEAHGRIEDEIPAQDLAVKLFFAKAGIEQSEDDEFSGGLVQLRGVQGNVEGDANDLVAVGVGEGDAPG